MNLFEGLLVPRTLLAFTITLWILSVFDYSMMGYAVALAIFTYASYEAGAPERKRQRRERHKRQMREWEIDTLAQIGGEAYMRRLLIEDLRLVASRRRAQALLEQMMSQKSSSARVSSSATTSDRCARRSQ